MFEYLSFLRPPPESCTVNQGVTLVPQIANDLRTEPCEEEHNIFFAWQNESGDLSKQGFTKLTTWRPGGAMYKPLTVALPSEARAGEPWRLCLAVPGPDQRTPSLTLDLSQPEFGWLPFPVTSLPIKVVAGEGIGTGNTSRKSSSRQAAKSTSSKPLKSKLKPIEQSAPTPHHQASKQEKIERFYLLPPCTIRPEWRSTLRITEQTSFDLDKASPAYRSGLDFILKVDSGVAVSSWLARLLASATGPRPLTSSSSTLEADLIECFQKRLTQTNHSIRTNSLQVIELGTGTGLVSIVLAGLLTQYARTVSQSEDTAPLRRARILATDLPSAVELIKHNQTINEHVWITPHDQDAEQPRCPCQIELHGMELDWDSPISPEVWEPEANSELEHAAHPFDIIIMADVTYNTASFSALLDTVTALLIGPSSGASTSAPMILLAYKCRDLAERTLWSDASARGISFVQVDTIGGVKEPSVEIWIGGWERDIRSVWSGVE